MNLFLIFKILFIAISLLTYITPSQGEVRSNKYKKSYNQITTNNKNLQKKINIYFQKNKISKKNIEKYLIQNNFFNFYINQTKDEYIIKNPIKTLFVIKGNSFLKENHLQQILKLDEAQFKTNFYETARGNIKTAYQQKGFKNIKIKQNIKRKNWKEWVYFHIKEGPRVRISKIMISGFFSKPTSEYVNFIINNSSPLVKKGFYNKKDLQKGYKNLLDHLRTNGFLQSKIYPDRVIFNGNLATIKVSLDEGPLTIIKDINLKRFHSVPIGDILSHIHLKVQSPLNLKTLEEDLIRIENFYKSKGFLEAKIINKKNIIEYEQEQQYANLIFSIKEGRRILTSRIIIEGLYKVKKTLVLNLLKFKRGEILTPYKINSSKKSLRATELFSQIDIDYKRLPDEGINVTVKLKERKPRSFRGGVGLTTERGLTARSYAEFSYKNLFGWGRGIFLKTNEQISLTRNINPFLEYEISGRYKEIFIPGKDYEGNVSVSKSKDIFNYSQEKINVIHKNKISFFVNKTIGDNINLKWNLFNLENRKEACINIKCPENSQKIGSSIFTFKWDNRDNIFNPTKGSLFSISGELASPYLASSADINFWKIYFQQQFYYNFIDDYTLAFAFKGGLIKATKTIPVSRAFILGGQTSIRGYDGNIEGERIPSAKITPIETANESLKLNLNNSIEEASKNSYTLIKLELRFPVSKSFKGLMFYDAGLIFIEGQKNNITEYGHSVGIGFRYETFILPIGLDIGYKLPPKTGVDYRFHFSIGLF